MTRPPARLSSEEVALAWLREAHQLKVQRDSARSALGRVVMASRSWGPVDDPQGRCARDVRAALVGVRR